MDQNSYQYLLSDRIWKKLGCEHSASVWIDVLGTAVPNAGVCFTARDAARLFQVFLNKGRVGNEQIVPADFITDVKRNRNFDKIDLRFGHLWLPPWYGYRSLTWSRSTESVDDPATAGYGLGCQQAVADSARGNVLIKFGSSPDFQALLPDHTALMSFSKALTKLVD
jgi:CubicO group peptidase (beta-lactamase class C family)